MSLNERGEKVVAWTMIGIAIAIGLVAVYWPFPAYPQEAVVTPGAAAVVPEGTEIVIPWGTWISELSSVLGTLIFAVIVWLMRKLPANIVAILQTMRAEQLLQKAIDYGINATAGAVKGKTVTVDVANEIIARAVKYAVDNGAPAIVEWIGGPEGIGRKLIARIPTGPSVIATDVVDVASGAPILAEARPSGPLMTSEIRPSGEF